MPLCMRRAPDGPWGRTRECLNVRSSNWAGITFSIEWLSRLTFFFRRLPNFHETTELPVKITPEREKSKSTLGLSSSLVKLSSIVRRRQHIQGYRRHVGKMGFWVNARQLRQGNNRELINLLLTSFVFLENVLHELTRTRCGWEVGVFFLCVGRCAPGLLTLSGLVSYQVNQVANAVGRMIVIS